MMAHVYMAAQLNGTQPKARIWPDLDYIIRKQTEKTLRIGGQQFYKQYCMAMGISATKLRKYKDGSWLVPYAERHVFGKVHQLNPMALHVIAATTDDTGIFVKARAHGDMGALIEQVVKAYHKRFVPEKSKQKGSTMTATLLQTLKTFAQALRQDEFALNFDVAALNDRAITVLIRMMDTCVEEFPDLYPKEAYSSVGCLGGFVANLFLLHDEQGLEASGFAIVCRILYEVVKDDGGVETSGALKRIGLKWVDDIIG
jgi:hypothetical protein